MKKLLIYSILAITLSACGSDTASNEPLPFIGRPDIVDGMSIPHTVDSFSFYNQDSMIVNNLLLSKHIYIADYFFIHCPSICPFVKKQMLRLYERYKNEPLIKLVSITMDPKRDDVPALKKYANKLGINDDRWWLLTGDKDLTLTINAEFFIAALEDDEAPGGFNHSGKLVMVDLEGRVRGFAEGTDKDDVTDMFKDIDKLIKEVKGN